jgi:hypothetical protein
MVLAHLTSNLLTLLLTSVLFLIAFLVVLRKLRPYLDALRHVESPPIQTAEVPAPPELPLQEEVPVDPGSAEKFELGPTYAEEMRSREEAARQQEQAVMEQIFAQNLVLREQIAELGEG